MNATQKQIRLMQEIDRWGELSMDAEIVAGCHGAAFAAMLGGLIKRGWIAGNQSDGMVVTEAGRKAMEPNK